MCVNFFMLDIRSTLKIKGAHFILEHFDVFFSVVIHGSKVELAVCQSFFSRLHKGNILYRKFIVHV